MTHDLQSTIFTSLFAAADNLGFRYASFGSALKIAKNPQKESYPWLAVNYPDRWIHRYIDEEYCAIDPVVALCPTRVLTADWSELAEHQGDFFADAASFGLKSGVAVPIHAKNRQYFMCFASDHEGRVSPDVQSNLEGLAFRVFQCWYRATLPSTKDYGLSGKTLQVLEMMGTEQTTQQIADTLGMTKDGVAWHLKTARQKLGCKKTTQAHGMALTLGLFDALHAGVMPLPRKKKVP